MKYAIIEYTLEFRVYSMKRYLEIYVCDDQASFIDKICQEIKRVLENVSDCQIQCFDNGDDLLEQCRRTVPDIVFLDIDMPGLDGFSVANVLQNDACRPRFAFVTSHDEDVFQALHYQPFWFVRKSHLEDLKIVLSRLLAQIEYDNRNGHCICRLRSEKRVLKIDLQNLTLVESSGHDIVLKYKNGSSITLRGKMADAEKQLEPYFVVRVQNGILVNCRYIARVTSRDITLLDGQQIAIGRKRVDAVKNQFQTYMRSF